MTGSHHQIPLPSLQMQKRLFGTFSGVFTPTTITILGVIIAAAVIRLLRNSINLLGISTHLEYAIIGMVILCGVAADEIIKRVMAKRRTAQANTAKK